MAEKKAVSDVTSEDRLWAALAYFFTPLVPIIILLIEGKKDRPFIKEHNVQALVFGIILYAGWSIIGTLTLGLIGICLWPIGIAGSLYLLYLTFKAFQGETVTIPIVTDFVKNQGWA
jgi:uncharacterized membrane protein